MLKAKTKNVLLVILSLVFALTLISFVAVRPAKAEGPIVSMKETAAVRIDQDGKNGIRFTGYVADSINLSQAVEGEFSETDTYAGIIVAREELSASELTHAVLDAEDYIDVPAVKYDPLNDTELGRAFNAVIYQIPEQALANQLTARAYVRIDGEYTYSETVTTRSLAGVASSAILKDNPTSEDLEILKGYVTPVNPVIKIGDTELIPNGTTEITLESFASAPITVSPKDIAFDVNVEKDSMGIMLENNMLTAIGGTEKQYVYIDIAGDFYEVEIDVTEWKDTNIAENVLADFGEKEYLSTIWKNGGTVTYLDAETATAELGEASDGVIKITNCWYNYIKIPFAKPVNLNEISKLYIKLRHNTPDGNYLQFAYLDENNETAVNEEYKGNSCSSAVSKASVWCGTTTYTHVVDQITTIEMSMGSKRFHWGTYSPWYHVPEVIDHICIYALRGDHVIYVEEIGIIP